MFVVPCSINLKSNDFYLIKSICSFVINFIMIQLSFPICFNYDVFNEWVVTSIWNFTCKIVSIFDLVFLFHFHIIWVMVLFLLSILEVFEAALLLTLLSHHLLCFDFLGSSGMVFLLEMSCFRGWLVESYEEGYLFSGEI